MNVGHSECGEELRFLIEEFTFLAVCESSGTISLNCIADESLRQIYQTLRTGQRTA
jgi:hypothetical protein